MICRGKEIPKQSLTSGRKWQAVWAESEKWVWWVSFPESHTNQWSSIKDEKIWLFSRFHWERKHYSLFSWFSMGHLNTQRQQGNIIYKGSIHVQLTLQGQVASQYWSQFARFLSPLYFHSIHCHPKNSAISSFREAPLCAESISVHLWDEWMTLNKPSSIGKDWGPAMSWCFLPWSPPIQQNSPTGN